METKRRTLGDICHIIEERGLADEIILCLHAATALLGTSTLWMMSTAPVYTHLLQEQLPDCLEKIDIPFDDKETTVITGIRCTAEEQTILDMLEFEIGVGNQDLYESLSDYYYAHGKSFQNLIDRMTEKQRNMFEIYEYDAIHFYEEG